VSQWLQTTSIVFSIWLIIPVLTVVINVFLTVKNKWKAYSNSVPLRFLIMGNLFYILVAVQGATQATRNLNEFTSKTDWVVGHAHMALLGFATFFAIGGVYHTISVITQKPIWSRRLAEVHFSLSLVGAVIFFLSLMIGGFFQGVQWSEWAQGTSYAAFQQHLANLPFLQTIADMRPWWALRALGGALLFLGACVFAVNIFNTIILPRRDEGSFETVVKEG
jgi:cytochrome c oxidase cbb3-type subunit 1